MVTLYIARGDIPASVKWPPVKSVLPNVSDAAWDSFVRVLSVQSLDAVTIGLGWFEMRPRRLGELGKMTDLQRVGKNRRWEGTFVLPLTEKRFMSDWFTQYAIFADSMMKYDIDLQSVTLPDGVSRSGALTILHCAGMPGLKSWDKKQIPSTTKLVEKANGLF